MSEIKNLLAKMINKINSNEDRIENIEENGVGGGGGVVFIPVLFDDDNTMYCEKTVEEVYSLTKTNYVVFTMDYYGDMQYFPLLNRIDTDNGKVLIFGNMLSNGGEMGSSVAITEIQYSFLDGIEMMLYTVSGQVNIDENWL